MSRISRHQESILNFTKNKSRLSNVITDGTLGIKIDNLLKKCDMYVPIMLTTVLSSVCSKHNVSHHGRYIATGIEMLMMIVRMNDCKKYYENEVGVNYFQKIQNKLLSLVNICLSDNIKHIQRAANKDKIIKIFHSTVKLLNGKIFDIIDHDELETIENITKSDLINFKFDHVKNPKKILMETKKIKKDDLTIYIQKKYGSVCQLAMVLGWALGNGDDKIFEELQKLGDNLGFMVKISYDFKNLERDMSNMEQLKTTNYIINNGMQDAFELFFDNKTKFIKGCMTHDLYTNTVKEIIDILEDEIDSAIDKMPADMKSQYTLSR